MSRLSGEYRAKSFTDKTPMILYGLAEANQGGPHIRYLMSGPILLCAAACREGGVLCVVVVTRTEQKNNARDRNRRKSKKKGTGRNERNGVANISCQDVGSTAVLFAVALCGTVEI